MNDYNDQASPTKAAKLKKWILAGSIMVTLTLIFVFALYCMGYFSPAENTAQDSPVVMGSNVKEGLPDTIEESEDKQKESMISVEIDAYPVFEDGTGEGNLNIVNPATNSVYLEVEITRDDTEEVIYKSGAIPPNSYIDNDKLSTVLEEGEYNATASVHAYDPENPDVEYNQAEFSLLITILN